MSLKTSVVALLGTLVMCGSANAAEFEAFGQPVTISSRVSTGMAWRVEAQDPDLIYKMNLNPGLCGYSSPGVGAPCYSQNNDKTINQRLVAARGAYNPNGDDGDLNFRKGSIVTAITKLNLELQTTWNDFNFKAAGYIFYDPISYDLTQTHPDTSYQPRRNALDRDSKIESGRSLGLNELFVSRIFNVYERDVNVTAGWQHIRWGESNLVAVNSVSEINPPDVRALHQPTSQIADLFQPTPAIQFGTNIVDHVDLDLVYLLGWSPVRLPEGGTFYGTTDIYKKSGSIPGLLAIGQFHEDPNYLQHSPGLGQYLSSSTQSGRFLPADYNDKPWYQGQFGGTLNFFLSDFNGGTEVSLYVLDYKSRLPYVSFYAANKTCIKDTTTDIVTAIVADCHGANFISGGGNPLPFDSSVGFFEYPNHIQMYGVSFNTNTGKWSLAGEFSWRPNLPVQIQATDVLFSANNPAGPEHAIPLDLPTFATDIAQFVANPANLGNLPTAVAVVASPGFGQVAGSLAGGGGSGSSTSILPSRRDLLPDFVSVYRGKTVQPNQYVRGYERLNALQLDLTGIRALSSTENPIGADQILILTELGMSYFPDMPSRSRLQFEAGDAGATHASPGADGTGDKPGDVNSDGTIHHADGSQGSYASERFTPTQKTSGFATPFSAGYRFIFRFEYDNIFDSGINYKPQLVWSHDVYGIGPLPVQNFIQGRKSWQFIHDFELTQQWNVQLFYLGSTGGGTVNTLKDRDTAGFTVSYSY